MKKTFLLLLVWIYPIVSFSAIDECKTDVYFANGILTTRDQAKENAFKVLKPAIIDITYKGKLKEYKKHIGEVGYSYNETQGFTKDMIESGLQKFGWTWLNNKFSSFHASDLDKQVAAYRNSIESGHKVLVVAHSQGNLFTWEAWQRLVSESKLGWLGSYLETVSIASPMTANIKGETVRIDWDNDLVPRAATLGSRPSKAIDCEVRKVEWEDINSAAIWPKPRYNYVYQSEVDTIYASKWKAVEDGLDTNVHAFTFYMGQHIKDGETGEIFTNPFSPMTVLTDDSARTKIMTAIKTKLKIKGTGYF